MVSSAEAFGHFSGRPRFCLRAAVALAQVDEAGNRARWHWSVRVENLDGSRVTWARVSANASMHVDGVHVYDARTPEGLFDFRDGAAFHEWASGTTGWIQYNADGNRHIGFGGSVAQVGIFGAARAGGAVAADRINHPAHRNLRVQRGSDRQHTVRWDRGGAYGSAVIHRKTNSGPWQHVAEPGGNVASFTDTTTAANRRYDYRVLGRAGNAVSGWSNTATVFTTPAAPTGVVATRNGSSIRVSIAGRPPYVTVFDVENGGVIVARNVQLPWTHRNPDATKTHRYRVRTQTTGLYSGWSAPSNTVQLLAPPGPPSALTPNGDVLDVDETVTLRWEHSPVDASAQSAYELRYRKDGVAWATVTGDASSSYALDLEADEYEWQVRTKGAHPEYGAWSAVAVVTVIPRPGVAIIRPETEYGSSTIDVGWSFYQEQERPQSAWEVELRAAGDTIVESRNGTGATDSLMLQTQLTEGTWTVAVRAATDQVWSTWAQQSFVVAFTPPAPPIISGSWDEREGGVVLRVASGDADGMVAAMVRIAVQRSVTEGEWEPVATLTEAGTLLDWEALSYGATEYRATAYTVEGAAAVTRIAVVADSSAVWLSGSDGFGITARLPFDPVVGVTVSRQRTLKQYAGRRLPVAYTGEALSRVVAVSGTTTDRDEATADVKQLARVAHAEQDRFLYRDPDGRRIYGAIDSIQMPRETSTLHPDGWEGVWG